MAIRFRSGLVDFKEQKAPRLNTKTSLFNWAGSNGGLFQGFLFLKSAIIFFPQLIRNLTVFFSVVIYFMNQILIDDLGPFVRKVRIMVGNGIPAYFRFVNNDAGPEQVFMRGKLAADGLEQRCP